MVEFLKTRNNLSAMDKAISLIIPTYNEHDNIVPLVERINRALNGNNYKILFIDDNSRDGTAEVVTALSQKYPVEVIVRKDKKGLASAVVDGLEHVNGNIVLVMDADLQHPPEIIPELLKKINDGADMAIGSRYVKGGGCRGWSLTRRIISKGAIALAHVLLSQTRNIKDPMSGFFMFDKRAITNADLKPTGYKILLEILVKGQFRNVVEVPYIFETRSRGESKLKARTQIDYLKHVLTLMRTSGELLRFAKFLLVGLSGVGVNVGLQWVLTRLAGLQNYAALPISIEVSIITNFIFNDLFTFRDRRVMTVRATLWRLAKYNMVALPGAGINYGVALLLIHFTAVPDLVANIIGIILGTVWNYSLSTLWAWK